MAEAASSPVGDYSVRGDEPLPPPAAGVRSSSVEGEQLRSLLFIDMAYTTDEVRRRKHEQFFEARHSGGFFRYVWGLHPMADRIDAAKPKQIDWIPFSDCQTVIEGRAELYNWPRLLLPINLIVSQLVLLLTIVTLVKREKVSAVAATDPLYSGLFGLAISRLCRIPLAVHVVANYDDLYEATGTVIMPKLFPSRRLERAIIRFVLQRADLLAPATGTLREYCIRNGAPPERVSIFRVSKNMNALHHRPPDQRPGAERVLKKFGIDAAGPFLLSVARLEPVKLVDHAIRAMKPVLDAHPSAAGLLAGDGRMRPELERLTEELSLTGRVHFLGLVDQQSLSELIPACITVSPLTGMALFECAMGGSPVVAYRYDEIIHRLVQNGRTGHLVDLGDYNEMGRRLLEIVEDDELRATISRNIRKVALEFADLEALYRHEAENYSAMLARRRS